MPKNINLLIEQIEINQKQISFSDLLKICLLNKDLPHSKGEIYFLITTLKALGIFNELKNQEYEINWSAYNKLKKEGSI